MYIDGCEWDTFITPHSRLISEKTAAYAVNGDSDYPEDGSNTIRVVHNSLYQSMKYVAQKGSPHMHSTRGVVIRPGAVLDTLCVIPLIHLYAYPRHQCELLPKSVSHRESSVF